MSEMIENNNPDNMDSSDNIYEIKGETESDVNAASPEEAAHSGETAQADPEAPKPKGPAGFPKGANVAFLVIAGLAFVALTVVFLLFPRTRYSELEKRDLASFPDLSKITEKPAELTAGISQWFSDSEPFRDDFMTLSMGIRDAFRYSPGGEDDQVTFRPVAAPAAAEEGGAEGGSSNPLAEGVDNPLANENAKIANAGIVIVGSGPNVRALMAYGGSEKAGLSYISAVDAYAAAFPSVHVYALVAPLATEFYLPDKAAKVSKSQRATIEYIRRHLSPKVRFVDAYSALAAHVDEDIYLRTDHHWAPLGGFYAAKELARTAGVPFRGLESYDRHVVRNFVGSMYGYSKDISVKNAPEDFVYYTPKGLNYKTTYVTYNTNKDYQVVSESKPHAGQFFHHFKDGSGNAYLTFMGGDQHLVKVVTGTPSSRKLMIIKDSYGNTLPGYLFYSFSEVHVVDFRYFKRNMAKYVGENNITDIVIAFNVFNACSSSAAAKIKKFLTQASGDFSVPAPSPSQTAEDKNDRHDADRKDSGSAYTGVSEKPKKEIPEEPKKEEPKKVEPEKETPKTEPEPVPVPVPTDPIP